MSKWLNCFFSNLVLASCVHHDRHHHRRHHIRPNLLHISHLQILVFFRHDGVLLFPQRLPILIVGLSHFSLEIAFKRVRDPHLFLATYPRSFGGVVLIIQAVDLWNLCWHHLRECWQINKLNRLEFCQLGWDGAFEITNWKKKISVLW